MRKLAIALAVVAASCSGGDADPTSVPTTTTTTVVASTTSSSTVPDTTTTSTSTSTTTTTTTTTIPAGFASYAHQLFTLSYPDAWSEDPEFPAFGVGFKEDHTALALPGTRFSVSLEETEPGFDLGEHVQRIQDDLAFFVPDFRVLRSGEQDLDGARSLWFEYAEEFDGFPIAVREQVALRDDLLVTLTLISPVEFFEFDVARVVRVIESFRFA
jgi:hypothetical protein